MTRYNTIACRKINSRNIRDEGGYTKAHQHRFLIEGESLSFSERNVYDFGIMINPDYEIAPGTSGGIEIEKDGVLQWHALSNDNVWVPVRPLTGHEII